MVRSKGWLRKITSWPPKPKGAEPQQVFPWEHGVCSPRAISNGNAVPLSRRAAGSNGPSKEPDIDEQIKGLLDERKHLEDLLQQRFNFFLVIFGFAITAGVGVNEDVSRGLLILGTTVILFFVWMPLLRVGLLHEGVMKLIKTHKQCSLMRVRQESGIESWGPPNASHLMIYWVPFLCGLFLFIWGVTSLGCPCTSR